MVLRSVLRWRRISHMNKDTINKFTTKFTSESRRPIITLIAIVVVICAVIIFVIASLSKSEEETSGSFNVTVNSSKAAIDPNLSSSHQDAIRDKNKNQYETAKQTQGGVAIPFVLEGQRRSTNDNQNINVQTCGCTMSDEQFAKMLARAGVNNAGGNSFVEQIGNSDIFITADRYLADSNGIKLKFNANNVKLGEKGLLVDQIGNPVLLNSDEAVYLSNDGSIIDSQTNAVPLRGTLINADGVIILGNGKYAFRPGNMAVEGRSDVYVTAESQLVTVDGKGIRHAGNFVFRNLERELVNYLTVPLRWQDTIVSQNRQGHMVDLQGDVFKTPGILFSYDGTLIDNYGKLTAQLISLKRLGESDLYVDDESVLRDRFSGEVLNYGDPLRIGVGDQLFVKSGFALNHQQAKVRISTNGQLQVDVGQGSVRSGWAKNSQNVSLDRFGHLLSRQGKLTQRGESIVFLSADGYLADKDGKSIRYAKKDMFLDFNAYLDGGLVGLSTYDGIPVQDINAQRVYLNEAGAFVTRNGQLAQIGVSITDSNLSVVKSDGTLINASGAQQQLLSSNGLPIYFEGKEVFIGDNNQLFDEDGNPIVSRDGSALFLNDNGFIVDDNNNVVETSKFVTSSGVSIDNGTFTSMEPLTDVMGNPVLFNGKRVFKKGAKLFYADGTEVVDLDGSPLSVSQNGTVISDNGKVNQKLTSLLKTGATFGELVSVNGKPIKYNGRNVYRRADGSLVDQNGNLILTKDGKPIKMDVSGRVTDASGRTITEKLFTNSNGQSIGNTSFDAPGTLSEVTFGGKPLFYNGRQVYRRADGTIVDAQNIPIINANGKGIKVDENGQLKDTDGNMLKTSMFTDRKGALVENNLIDAPQSAFKRVLSNGEPIFFNGKEVYRRKDGVLVDENGKVLTTSNGKVIKLTSNGQITDEDGNVIGEPLFKTKTGEKVTNESIDSPVYGSTPLSLNGNPLFLDGQQIWKRADGVLVDRYGKPLTDKNGKRLRLDVDGKIVTEDGKTPIGLLVKDSKGNTVDLNKTNNIESFKAVTVDGKPLYFNGKQVFRRADGKLVDAAGNLVKTKSGKSVSLSINGELIDSSGNVVTEALLQDKEGNEVNSRLIDSPDFNATPLTANGKGVYYNGKKVWRTAGGKLVDANGVAILDENGNELFADETGKITDAQGKLVTDNIFTSQNGNTLDTSLIDPQTAAFKKLTINGKPVLFNGKQVYKRADGTIVDSDGNEIRTADGKKVIMTTNGAFVDENGKPILENVFTDVLGNKINNEDINTTSNLKTRLTAGGKPIFYKGKQVWRNADGKLVDENGGLVLTKDGKSVSFSQNGLLIDEDGNVVRENLFTTKDGQDISNVSLDVISAAPKLLTRNGKPLFIDGKRVFKRADGMLVDSEGNLIRNSAGRALRLNPNGTLSDSFGTVITERLFETEQGDKVATSEIDAAHKVSIPLTANSKPLYFNGRQVFKRADGVLVTEDGNVVTDSSGKTLQMSADGKIINSDGDTVSESIFTDKSGRAISNALIDNNSDSFKPISVNGEPLYFNGKRVFQRADGFLVDEQGNLVKNRFGQPVTIDSEGRIVDQSGKLTEDGLFTNSRGESITNPIVDFDRSSKVPLTANGKPIFYKGKQVWKRADGVLIDAQGNVLKTDSGETLSVLGDGTIVNGSGQKLKTNMFADSQGNIISNDTIDAADQLFKAVSVKGEPIYFNGQQVFKRADGVLVDGLGRPIRNKNGSTLRVNTIGEVVDDNGDIVESDMFTDKQGQRIPSLQVDQESTSTPVLANGKPIFYKGKQVFKTADGKLIDANGNSLLDEKGQALHLTENGKIVDQSGQLIHDAIFTDKAGNRIKANDIDASNTAAKPLMQNGKPVFVNGRQVFTRSDGTLIDSQGNAILDVNGNEMMLNESGIVTLPNGELPLGVTFTDRIGRELDSQLFTPRKFNAEALTASGKSVFYKGKKVYRRADGKLIDAEGTLIKDKNGKTLSMDEDGNIRDHNGNIVSADIFTDEQGTRVKTSALDKPNVQLTAVTANGKDVYINGKKVFRRSDGTLVDENNVPIKLNNKSLSIKSDGVLRDVEGNVITGAIFTDTSGRPISTDQIDPFINESLKMVTANGRPVLIDGKQVFRRIDGSLVDENGAMVTDNDGKAVFLDDSGRLVTADGEVVKTNLFTDQNGNTVSNDKLDPVADLPEPVQINGSALQFNGKQVYRRANGQLIDSEGQAIRDNSGQAVFLDENGKIVNESGQSTSVPGLTSLQPVANGNFKTRTTSASSGERLFTDEGFLLDENGKATTYKGESVKRGADGYIYTASGEPIRTKSGKKVKIDANGLLVDENGKVVKESLLKNGDGVALYSDGKPVTTAMKRIGNSDLYLTKDGRVVDSKGRAMKIENEDVFIDPETGALVNSVGKPFRDANANTIFLTDSGTIVDSSLNAAKGLLMKTEDGVAVASSGHLANDMNRLTKVEGTNYFKTTDGLLVDENGRPIIIEGQAAYIDSQGRLVNSKSRELRYRGQRVSIDSNGALVGQNGDVLSDSDGNELTLGDISDSAQPRTIEQTEQRDPIVTLPAESEPIVQQPQTAQVPADVARSEVQNTNTAPEANVQSNSSGDVLQLKGLTYAQKVRLKERYERIAAEMNGAANEIIVDANKVSVSKSTYYPKVETASTETALDGGDNGAGADKGQQDKELVAFAGDVLYAYTNQHLNTDLQNQLEVRIVGLPPKHILYNAIAFATPVIRYDNVVFEFNKICPQQKKCQTFSGIALDINTASAGINADIDEHFWYRFGGLFLASFGKGVSEGIELMGDRTETSSLAGSTTIITGIDTNDVIVKGLAESGEAFLPALAARFNRPITATLPYKTELVIKVLDTIEIEK